MFCLPLSNSYLRQQAKNSDDLLKLQPAEPELSATEPATELNDLSYLRQPWLEVMFGWVSNSPQIVKMPYPELPKQVVYQGLSRRIGIAPSLESSGKQSAGQRRQALKEAFEGMSDDEQVRIWNFIEDSIAPMITAT